MAGAIIGAAMTAASAIAGGISNSARRRAVKRLRGQQLRDNQTWYNQEYNADPTQRADAARLLTQMKEQLQERTKAARGRQNVIGSTEDSTTAAKEANNSVIADTISKIYASNQARKDSIGEEYRKTKDEIQGQQMTDEANAADNTAETVKTVAAVGAQIADAVDSTEGKSGKSNSKTDTNVDANKVTADAATTNAAVQSTAAEEAGPEGYQEVAPKTRSITGTKKPTVSEYTSEAYYKEDGPEGY